MQKRVIRGKIIREGWMNDNGLSNVISLIKKQKWENLFKRRDLMHIVACKELYANLTVFIYRKKEIAKSRVKGVEIEFDSMKLDSIMDVPGHTGISEYIRDVWEESKYIKPLEIMGKFTNNSLINVARRVQSTDMKPFQRFVHFVDYELQYGDWLTMIFEEFGVPLVDKKGEERKRYDYCKETFLTMCKLKREDGIWWIGTGENRRRDDAPEEEVPAENVHEEEEEGQTDFEWEAVVDEAAVEGESGSGEKFYDAEDEVQESPEENEEVSAVVAPDSAQQKVTETAGVDLSGPSGHLPESVMNRLQAEFERARANRIQADLEKAQAENARLLALLQQAQNLPKP
ncbi:hypothetical protein Dimus_029248 [Dionaea muscipula]